MSRTASLLLLLAALLCVASLITGAALAPPFARLPEEGAGAVDGFMQSRTARAHGLLGHLAAAACLPAAAAGFLLGLHGLLASNGPRLRAALLTATAPLMLFLALGAVYTGHASWEPTLLGELQAEVLQDFARTHGRLFGAGVGLGLLAQALSIAWYRRHERRDSEDEAD